MAGSLGVGVTLDGVGLSAGDHRQLLDYLWHNTGIIGGLVVSGRSDLRYNVAPGASVCSRSTADGKTETVWQGGTTSTVAAGDSAYDRIDCIYIIARNQNELGDDVNYTQIGVVQGAPSATPVKPAPPAGALVLSYMRMPAQATSTARATRVGDIDYAIPYGGRLKDFGYARRTDEVVIKGDTDVSILSVRINLPTDRKLHVRVEATLSSQKGDDQASEVKARIRIDKKQVGIMQNRRFVGAWETWIPTWELLCGRGEHTVELMMSNGYGAPAVAHGPDQWSGITLSVQDGGLQV